MSADAPNTPPAQQAILNKSRLDKFLLVLNLPNILKQVNKSNQDERSYKYLNLNSLQFSIYGSPVPNIATPEVDAPFSGSPGKFTSYSRANYDNIEVKFTVDNLFSNWWVLWYWLDLLHDSDQGIYNANNLADKDAYTNIQNYQTDITVFGLDEYNTKIIQFDYKKAFITGLGGINYDYRNAEEMESSFTFAFNQLQVKLL